MTKQLLITKKIKDLLKNKHLTGYKLSKIIGISDGATYSMIRGECPFPDEIIEKLAPILEISPDTIKGWTIADKYPKDLLQKAFDVKQQNLKNKKPILLTRVNELMQAANLNITKFAVAIDYNQGWLSQILLEKEPASDLFIKQLSNYSNIPEDEIKSWIIADKYSVESLRVALEC